MLRGKVDNYLILKDNDLKKYVKSNEEGCAVTVRRDVQRRRCHYCGATTHLATDCSTKDKGMKCFGCHDYGHVAVQCQNKQTPLRNTYNVTKFIRGKYHKGVIVNDCETVALIDTGSDMTLMRADKYIKLGVPSLQHNEIHFHGVGSTDNA